MHRMQYENLKKKLVRHQEMHVRKAPLRQRMVQAEMEFQHAALRQQLSQSELHKFKAEAGVQTQQVEQQASMVMQQQQQQIHTQNIQALQNTAARSTEESSSSDEGLALVQRSPTRPVPLLIPLPKGRGTARASLSTTSTASLQRTLRA